MNGVSLPCKGWVLKVQIVRWWNWRDTALSGVEVKETHTGSNPVLTTKLNNMKLKFSRVQEVEVELKREPTTEELKILLGKDIEASMFDLPEDLIDWDSEDVVGEDYSSNTNIYIPKPEIIK